VGRLLFADVIGGKLKAVPRGVMIAGAIIDGARGAIDLPKADADRVKSRLANDYRKVDESAPWERGRIRAPPSNSITRAV
jgi:hypothetical protein